MAEMNLLRASIRGKLGQVYGTTAKGQAVLRAVPFSHAPHNEKQTKAVRAFEKVNRVAGGVAKYFWHYLNLSDKKMLRHNAVAKWFAPALAGGEFNMAAIPALVRDDADTSIDAATVNTATGAFAVECGFTDVQSPEINTQGAVLLLDENGKVIFGSSFVGASFAYAGLARLDPALAYSVLLLRSDKINNRWVPNSWKLAACATV